MAVFITGVGGISTADATALPEDVASGRIFYNADGRQIGTGEKGLSTADATALPEDVAAGKIFYNADGRQIGVYNKLPLEIKSMILPSSLSGNSKRETFYQYTYYSTYDGYNWEVYQDEYSSRYDYYSTVSGINAILGLKINDGDFCYLPSIGSNLDSFGIRADSTSEPVAEYDINGEYWYLVSFLHCLSNKTIYIGECSEDWKVEIFYI